MDSATKEVLLNILKNLKESTQNTYYASEMSWRTYTALTRMFPEFSRHYGAVEEYGVTFSQMLHWRDVQLQQLDAAIRLIEEWR
jgi:hypothetical protein